MAKILVLWIVLYISWPSKRANVSMTPEALLIWLMAVTWPDGTSIQGKWMLLPAQFADSGKEERHVLNLCTGRCLFTSAQGETASCDWDSDPVDAVPYDGKPFHKVGLNMQGDKIRLKHEEGR